MKYKNWLDHQSRIQGRDISQDEYDYDLEQYFNSLKTTPIEAGHLPDTFKKPNHPTFSNQSMYHIPIIQEGGEWNEEGQFTPSKLNLQNMRQDQMQRYFNEVESPEALNLPKNDRFSRIKEKIK